MAAILGFLFLLMLFMWIGFLVGQKSVSHQPVAEPPPLPFPQDEFNAIEKSVSQVLLVGGHHIQDGVLNFEGRLKIEPDKAAGYLLKTFTARGMTPILQEAPNHQVRIRLFPGSFAEGDESSPRWGLHAFLFVATFITCTIAGAKHSGGDPVTDTASLGMGLFFSVGLLLILGAHEFGHYFMAKKHGVNVTPPFFIPVPFGLGTFGAFIKLKGLSPHRVASFDVAVAGPLAGLVFAIPALLLGLHYSEVIQGIPQEVNWIVDGRMKPSSSLVMAFFSKIILGKELLEGDQIVLHPLAYAGWIGMLVTALNLLPIGQLDGGHMVHALFGAERGHSIGVSTLITLFILTILVWPWLLMWAIIIFLVAGTRDVPPLNDVTPLDRSRMILGYSLLVLLLAILLPLPNWG